MADVADDRRDLPAKEDQGDDRNDRDEGEDQGVFGQSLALVARTARRPEPALTRGLEQCHGISRWVPSVDRRAGTIVRAGGRPANRRDPGPVSAMKTPNRERSGSAQMGAGQSKRTTVPDLAG